MFDLKQKTENATNWAAAKVATVGALALAGASSYAAGLDDLFDAVDISGVSAKVTALAVLIVGIAFVMKGPSIVKRIISKI